MDLGRRNSADSKKEQWDQAAGVLGERDERAGDGSVEVGNG